MLLLGFEIVLPIFCHLSQKMCSHYLIQFKIPNDLESVPTNRVAWIPRITMKSDQLTFFTTFLSYGINLGETFLYLCWIRWSNDVSSKRYVRREIHRTFLFDLAVESRRYAQETRQLIPESMVETLTDAHGSPWALSSVPLDFLL